MKSSSACNSWPTKQEDDNMIHCQRCMLCLGNTMTDQGICHPLWLGNGRHTYMCSLCYFSLDVSADTKDAMVFQIQRSKLQVFEGSNTPSMELRDTWKSFENYLARRLISFSRSKAAFQFKIVDHNKKTYLTVSLYIYGIMYASYLVRYDTLICRYGCWMWFVGCFLLLHLYMAVHYWTNLLVEKKVRKIIDALLSAHFLICFVGLPDSQPGHDRFKNALVLKLLFQCELVSPWIISVWHQWIIVYLMSYIQEDSGRRPTFSIDSESLEMTTEECLILVLLLLQSNQLIPPSHRVTNQLQLFKVRCIIL